MPQPPQPNPRRPGPLERDAMGLLRQLNFHLTDPREIREMRTTFSVLERGEAQATRQYVAELRRALDAHEERRREQPGTARHHIAMVTGRRPASTNPPPRLPRLSDVTDPRGRGPHESLES